MILRWVAVARWNAERRFRRVRRSQGMSFLSADLARNDERIDGKLKVEEAA